MKDNTFFEKFTEVCGENVGMYYCGKRIGSENHVYGPEIRTHFLIVLVEKGTAVLYGNDRETEFGEKDLLIMFPDEKILYRAKSKWSIKWIGISGKNLEKTFNSLGITRNNPIFRSERYSRISEIFSEIYDTDGTDLVYAKFKIQSLLHDFFAELFAERNVKNMDVAESAVRIMKYNYTENLTVKEIADKFYLDSAYFSRLFKRKIGIPPKKYILNLRIRRATELLEKTDYKIKDIAKNSGFEDSLYFSKIFYKTKGITPTEYRKKSRIESI